MNRTLTALFAAREAVIALLVGIGIPLVPLTVLWAAQYGFAPDWSVFWRGAVDFWLLGHGVDLTVTLDRATAASAGFPTAGAPFALSIAALGFALLTVLFGSRAHRRIAQTGHGGFGEVVAIVSVALLSLAAAASAVNPAVRPSLLQAATLPAFAFGLGILLGRLRDPAGTGIPPRLLARWRPNTLEALGLVARGGAAAAALVVAAGALALAALLLVNYAQIISLYEGLHTEVLGGIAVTVGELAFLPNLVIWAAAWLIGPGFAIGAGSSVGPLATSLGPIPAIPVLGALPSGTVALGFAGLAVPVLAGFLAGALADRGSSRSALRSFALGVGMGLFGGAILSALAWFSAGAVGPGRLAITGPNPWAVAGFAALEIGIAAVLGLLSSARAAPER